METIYDKCRLLETNAVNSNPSHATNVSFYKEQFFNYFRVDPNSLPDAVTAQDIDDMLFYVRKIRSKSNSVSNLLEVTRRYADYPIPDSDINWRATFYANLVLHKLQYTLICAIGKTNSRNTFSPIDKCTKKVYPSPSKARMDRKGRSSSIMYPHVIFTVDDFGETFSKIIVGKDCKLAVELVATVDVMNIHKPIFAGMVDYTLLKSSRDKSLANKTTLTSRIMKMYRSGAAVSPYEFIKMNGPKNKGSAEVAISLSNDSDNTDADDMHNRPISCHVTYIDQHIDNIVNDVLFGKKSPVLM